eukprot:CAMPEP_0196728770 /NCGR_PEP_ID=MMETSP1091-20130531/9355_1 /TAXON_ID=302021 /ORGANISM="Rhodomonas sp., Strain CCMP768" /LENGTH=63 /DNA_ID=CAMNT_0042071563 /DNA_START=207 /DNA_END=395 /DNA_ORIENTATION=-
MSVVALKSCMMLCCRAFILARMLIFACGDKRNADAESVPTPEGSSFRGSRPPPAGPPPIPTLE